MAYPGLSLRSDFRLIEYAFTEVPRWIVGNKEHRSEKRGLRVVPTSDAFATYQLLRSRHSPAFALEFARRWARSHPGQEQAVNLLCAYAPNEEALAYLEPLRRQRPVLLGVHLQYQSLSQNATSPGELAVDYRALQAAEPDNADLLFLLGRVAESRTESLELHRRATAAAKPSAHAFAALAQDAAGQADWALALERIRPARQLLPSEKSFRDLERTSLLGLRRFDEYLSDPDLKTAVDLSRAHEFLAVVLVQDLAGQRAAADAAVVQVETQLKDYLRQGIVQRALATKLISSLTGVLRLQRGEDAAAAEIFERASTPNTTSVAAQLRGRFAEALAAQQTLPQEFGSPDAGLILYAGAAKAGDASAEEIWKICLEEEPGESRTLALMRSAKPATVAALLEVPLEPMERAALAVALAFRPGADRRALLDLARSLAVVPGAHRELIRRVAE